jgi:hypothetical protein
MSVHLVASKEILSFHELERRKLFDHNKRLLAVRLEAMEREIKHLTKDYNKDFTPKGPAKTIKLTSQPIIQPEEELERERNWPRTEDHLFQKKLNELNTPTKNSSSSRRRRRNSSSSKNKKINTRKRLKHSASAPLSTKPALSNMLTPTKSSHSRSNTSRLLSTQRKKRKPKLVPLGGGLGPRFPRPILSGVMNGPTPQDYDIKGDFGSHPMGEMIQTFAWDETRDRDWFQEGAFWDLRMKNLANERKASMLARQQAAKKMQSRRLKQQAKDELIAADQNDKRQKSRPRNWFIKNVLENSETLTFQYIKAGQLGTSFEQNFGKNG